MRGKDSFERAVTMIVRTDSVVDMYIRGTSTKKTDELPFACSTTRCYKIHMCQVGAHDSCCSSRALLSKHKWYGFNQETSASL
jgi:hypothetical protein